VTIPDSVTSIGDYAFDGCSRLTSITVADGNSAYASVNGVLFDKSQTTLVQYPPGKTGGYAIPSSVLAIGNFAFSDCSGLTSVTIPSGVVYIGYNAFASCTGLTSVTIPGSVLAINNYAFSDCGGLTSVVFLGAAPPFIGLDVFTSVATGFTVNHVRGGKGFTSPTWYGYTTVTMADLTNLTMSSGTLTPSFAGATTSYTASVPNATTSITVTPTLADSMATVKVNGTTVVSGRPSASIPLAVGTNTITTVVTAQDGTTTSPYTLTVTRALSLSPVSTLSGLALSAGTLSPAFAAATTDYTASVPYAMASITVTPTVTDSNATVKVNGTPVASGAASTRISVNPDSFTVVLIEVTAQDGTTTSTYTVKVTRAPAVSTLSDLALSSGTLTPTFSAGTTAYTASVPNTTTSITVTPTATDSNATVKVNGTPVASGAASTRIWVYPDSLTVVLIQVVAQDGTTTSTYSVLVYSPPLSDSTLSGLALSAGTLSPTFAAATTDYTASVPNATTSITVTPMWTSMTYATVTVNGTLVRRWDASASIPLVVGPNTITTVVTAQDGTTKSTYTVTVTRNSNICTLLGLTLSSGTLSPTFAAATNSYTASVPYATASITVTPTVTDATATVKVKGTTVASTTASDEIPLTVGSNTITTVVTAQDGTTSTYTVTVTRAAPSTVSTLSGLALSAGTLSPAFATGTLSYTASVPNATTSITVRPTVTDSTATVKVNETPVALGDASGAIPLAVGTNTITTVVTAQDGTTTSTYTLTVTRANGMTYTVADGKVTITGYTGVGGAVTLPSTIEGYPVTSIGNGAFQWCSSLTSVTIPGSVTSIGDYAFRGCTALTSIAVAEGNSAYASANGVLFDKSQTTLVQYPGGKTGAYTIPGSVTSIGYGAFASCTGLTSITIPVSVTRIGSGAFQGCSGLTSVYCTGNAPDIGTGAFEGVTATLYYVAGTTGWTNSFGGLVTRAPLSGLALSAGTLSPSFAGATTSYTASVPNATASITVTPTVTDSNVTVTVNGTNVASGSPSASIPLVVGPNTITVVAAQDGSTQSTYTLTVTRAPSAVSTLSSLVPSSGTLSPTFAAATTNYTASVPNATTSIMIMPTVTDSNATVTVNWTTVASGSPSAPIPLVVGTNTITTVVTAQDGSTTSYTVTVTRRLSSVSTLSNIVFNAGLQSVQLSLFGTASVANAITSITATPTVTDFNATVKVKGIPVTSGTASGPISLDVGPNPVTVVVTAQDGSNTTYNFTVTRAAPSTVSTLSGLALSVGTLSPTFPAMMPFYAASVANAITSITVTPTATDSNATVTVSGMPVASRTASGAIPLAVGANTITTVVTAQDGSTKSTYTVTVTRAAPSTVSTLSGLALSAGTLSPTFATGTLSYTASVPDTTITITVTPTVTDAAATVAINGTTVASGDASGPIPLDLGENTITIVVTAQDGTTTSTYTVTVSTTGYETWKATAFTNPADLANPAVSGELATPAHDGTTNLMKYAMALDPMASSAGSMPTMTLEGGYLALTYRKSKTATDVTFTVQATDSLTGNSWTPATTVLSQTDPTPGGGSYWLVTVRDNVTYATHPRRFLRLQVGK